MGVWDVGNYDNDGALDYVGSMIDDLAAKIDAILADESLAGLDENGESILMPSVDMISTLCERSRCATPKSEVIAGWQKRYLEVYDAEIEEMQPSDGYASARRKVISETFERLRAQAQKFWGDE